jgi:predicted nucleotidyltransferase
MNNSFELVRMVFGSHLYGTNTPCSDTDYKGVFMPGKEEILLGRIPKTLRLSEGSGNTGKNTSEDVDEEHYSLHYFIELACKGETVALDMLHAGPEHQLNTSSIWESMKAQRSRFYTKNLKALVGYARRQAAKYGVKGSRLAEAKRVLDILRKVEADSPDIRLEDVWDELPESEYLRKEERTFPETVATYDVCGKKLQSTARARQYIDTLARFVDAYGARARAAEKNEGIDWKAVSHAFRAAYQVEAILKDGGYSYPLPQTDLLVSIKKGVVPYKLAGPALEDLIDELEKLSAESDLPEKADRRYWDRWLLAAVERSVI